MTCNIILIAENAVIVTDGNTSLADSSDEEIIYTEDLKYAVPQIWEFVLKTIFSYFEDIDQVDSTNLENALKSVRENRLLLT